MKQGITGIALVSMFVFTATAWSQESPMERKMGMGKMKMGEMETGESPHMKACMQMMSEMETTDAALEDLVERMQTAEGAEKMAAIEEILTVLVTQRRERHERMRSSPKMMCGGMMK